MDLHRILGELHAERQRLGRIIQTLEELHSRAIDPPKKRGRKGMDADARRAVSARMKRYWAARREEEQKTEPQAPKSAK